MWLIVLFVLICLWIRHRKKKRQRNQYNFIPEDILPDSSNKNFNSNSHNQYNNNDNSLNNFNRDIYRYQNNGVKYTGSDLFTVSPSFQRTHVDLCILDGYSPSLEDFHNGTQLFFQLEPDNPKDSQAVCFVNQDGVRGGYLWRSNLKNFAYHFLLNGNQITGVITYRNATYDTEAQASLNFYIMAGSYTSPSELKRDYFWNVDVIPALASRLIEARTSRKLSRKALSDLSGVSTYRIGQYENREQTQTDPSLVSNLADALGVTVGWLTGMTDNQREECPIP